MGGGGDKHLADLSPFLKGTGVAEIMNAWFDKVEDVLMSAGLDLSSPDIANRMWNCDETTFSTSASASKILAHKRCQSRA